MCFFSRTHGTPRAVSGLSFSSIPLHLRLPIAPLPSMPSLHREHTAESYVSLLQRLPAMRTIAVGTGVPITARAPPAPGTPDADAWAAAVAGRSGDGTPSRPTTYARYVFWSVRASLPSEVHEDSRYAWGGLRNTFDNMKRPTQFPSKWRRLGADLPTGNDPIFFAYCALPRACSARPLPCSMTGTRPPCASAATSCAYREAARRHCSVPRRAHYGHPSQAAMSGPHRPASERAPRPTLTCAPRSLPPRSRSEWSAWAEACVNVSARVTLDTAFRRKMVVGSIFRQAARRFVAAPRIKQIDPWSV